MAGGAALADDPTANTDLENRFGSQGLDFGHSQRGRPSDLDWDALANLAEQGPESLVECVLRQIDLTIFDPRQRVIAYALSEALEPTGWLGRELAKLLMPAVLTKRKSRMFWHWFNGLSRKACLRAILPSACRSRPVREDFLDPVMAVVLDNLQMLANGDIAQLARRAGATTEDISRCLKQIREFNPKPGEAYEAAPLRVHAPDVIVTKGP